MTIVDMRILDKRTGRAAGAKKNLSLKYKVHAHLTIGNLNSTRYRNILIFFLFFEMMTIDGQSGGGSKIAKKVMTSYMTAPLKKVRPLIGLDRVLCSSIINILNILIEYLGLVGK